MMGVIHVTNHIEDDTFNNYYIAVCIRFRGNTSNKVEVILRPTVSRPVCLGVRHPSDTRDQFFSFLSLIIFRKMRFVDVERPL
jgi:hypothetical protein